MASRCSWPATWCHARTSPKSSSAGDISSRFDMTGATISYHLSILKKADLVRESREKNFIYYELNASVFEELMMWFSQFQHKGGNADDTNGGKTNERTE